VCWLNLDCDEGKKISLNTFGLKQICQTFQIFCATPLSGSTSDLESQERLVRPSSSSPSAASATAGCLRVGNGGGGGGQAGSRRRSGSRTSSGSSDNEEDCETRWGRLKPQKCLILFRLISNCTTKLQMWNINFLWALLMMFKYFHTTE
jgi:hypothetical protein